MAQPSFSTSRRPMPKNVLISGPAGASKSAVAKALVRDAEELTVLVDFQALNVALTGVERDANGKYPIRDPRTLPITEYVRRAAITAALARGISIVATNSDGDPARRLFLLRELGADSVERVIDPGRQAVESRLVDPITGELSDDCRRATERWYSRK